MAADACFSCRTTLAAASHPHQLIPVGESRERRYQLVHPAYKKPELRATAPNQFWSWDITKLLGPAKWTYFYLYVILDVFSRYITGWMVAPGQSAELARQFIAETIGKNEVPAAQLNIHADRGRVMTSKPVAFLIADLGVTRTHSRPYVSDDNPHSDSQFRTMKYRPEFQDRFGCIQDSRAFCQQFFPGTTRNIATPASVFSLRLWFTSETHRPLWHVAKWSSTPPTKRTQTASLGNRPNRCLCPRRFGSTSRLLPAKRQKAESQ